VKIAQNTAIWIVGGIALHFIIYLIIQLAHLNKVKNVLYTIDLMILILIASLIDRNFWLLASATNAEFTSKYTYRLMMGSSFMLVLYLLITDLSLLKQQGILFILILLIMSILVKYEEKLIGMKKMNEDLRDKLYEGNRRLEYIQKEVSQIEQATKVQERNLLVQKLHDKIGHTLAANIMQLEVIKMIVHKNKEDAIKMLEATINNLRNGMDDIRHTLRDIKPEQSEVGINQIKKILDDLKCTHSIDTELFFEGDLSSLTLNIWHVIIQNLKEAITNLLKYSKADRLSVRIEIFHKIIKVQFKDNGLPIEYYEKGLGLMGIEERTQSINGRLVIHTDNGFEILMIISREGI
jgi:signal transduction histidine kinase